MTHPDSRLHPTQTWRDAIAAGTHTVDAFVDKIVLIGSRYPGYRVIEVRSDGETVCSRISHKRRLAQAHVDRIKARLPKED